MIELACLVSEREQGKGGLGLAAGGNVSGKSPRFEENLAQVISLAREHADRTHIIPALQALLPTYQPIDLSAGGENFPGVLLAVRRLDAEQSHSSGPRELARVPGIEPSWSSLVRARLGAKLETAGDAVVILGADRSVRYINPAYERLFGHTLEEAAGLLPEDLMGEGAADISVGLKAIAKAGEAFSARLTSRRKDGSPVPLVATFAPLREGAEAGGRVIVARKSAPSIPEV